MRALFADRREHLSGIGIGIGMAWLLVLFVVSVYASTGRVHDDQLPIQLRALSGATLARDGRALLLSGDAAHPTVATLQFKLPPWDPASSRWVVWLERDPLDTLWLEGPHWRSDAHSFFHPVPGEGLLPNVFLIPLPTNWQGDVTLTLHASAGTRVALQPKLLHEAPAMQKAHRRMALESAIYSGFFMLALLALALYGAARDRSFLALFACACAALLLLGAQNGQLYVLPGFALFAAWRGAGVWALGLVFAATALQALLRYAALRDGEVAPSRWLDACLLVPVAVATLCLLDLRILVPALQVLMLAAWLVTCGAALYLLAGAARKGVPMACALFALVVLTIVAALARTALAWALLEDTLWTRFGYQLCLVATAAVLTVGLVSRVAEFRGQRDRERLAREDSERRLQRQAARAELTLALQSLRGQDSADIEWLALRLLLEHLVPQVPVHRAAVFAFGYHGHDLLLVEPPEHNPVVAEMVAERQLPLKRLAMQATALQQARTHAGEPSIEALLPLAVRAPGWGMLLLERQGQAGFSTDEMELAAEFARLATGQADEALATAQLRRTADLDALTGTFNRRSIDQWFTRAFLNAFRQGRPLSLLFIDIDHFKLVNDRLGHAGGDCCLRLVATALRGALEPGDTLGRYGGEEFVVLLPGRHSDAARTMGERLRTAVEQTPFEFEGHVERLTVSVGVATRLERESTPTAAIKRADKALYEAKNAGRNCVQVAPGVFG